MAERENTVAVIGGLGRMGIVETRKLEEAGFTCLTSDIKDPKTLSAREAIRQSGIVFFSVLPIGNIENIIRATQDVFNGSHRVLDNASLKDPLRLSYEILDSIGASICSTHPLHKEDQPPFGQNNLFAPFGKRPQDALQIAEQVNQKAGMALIRIDFDKHDSTMLYNQLLPHLVNRAVGHTLAEDGIDIEALQAISTANSKIFSLAYWRTLVQPGKISDMLISNALKSTAGQRLVKSFRNSVGVIKRQGAHPGKLEKTFDKDVALLDPTKQIRAQMNEASIITLQHLANLAKRSIVVETHEKDREGLLRDLLDVVADNRINLNTTLSEIIEGGFRFYLGIEKGVVTPQLVELLDKLGYRIVDSTTSQ